VQFYAAGSLRAALTEVAGVFEAESGHAVQGKYGPSGLLKDEIASGGLSTAAGSRYILMDIMRLEMSLLSSHLRSNLYDLSVDARTTRPVAELIGLAANPSSRAGSCHPEGAETQDSQPPRPHLGAQQPPALLDHRNLPYGRRTAAPAGAAQDRRH
jgi:hypothetical protein